MGYLRNRGMWWAAILSLLALAISGCSLGTGGKTDTPNLEPPKEESSVEWDEKVQMGAEEEEEQGDSDEPEATGRIQLTLYFLDQNGLVVPLAMEVPKVVGIAQEALRHMIQGGPGEEKLPEGFAAPIPANTRLSVNVKEQERLAVVDFSKEFQAVEAGQGRKVLEAITYTLTEFPHIDKVEITVNGYPLEKLGNYPVQQPLSRATMGINLEMSDSAIAGSTSALTLYFQGANSKGETYLVPVTRLIPRVQEEELARATLEELIRGPALGSPLSPTLIRTIQVLDVKLSGQKVVANLDEHMISFLPEEEGRSTPALTSMVLSLTQNTGAKEMQLMINGEQAVSPMGVPVMEPLMPPKELNPI